MKNPHVTHRQASSLLHNKFVVVLGGSIERGMYKDLVLLLQRDNHLSLSQLKTKGEDEFENDELLEGGRKGQMTNGVHYKEVRQYTSDHHRVRFYFLTRIYSDYVQRVLEDFKDGLKPDLVIVNSSVWDISRYGRCWEPDYLQNLTTFFEKLRTIIPDEALIIWNLAMPLGKTIIGGFLVPEITELGPSLRFDVIEANYCAATLANVYGLDVLDLHFQFRFSLQHRMKDGVHWNAVAHRRITCLLLEHVAKAWGVELPPSQPPTGMNHNFGNYGQAPKKMSQQPWKAQKPGLNVRFPKQEPGFKEVYQRPRNVQNSVTRWRAQEQRTDYCWPPATPTKPLCYFGGLNHSFSDLATSTNEKYQHQRTTHNSVTRWGPQERRADYCLLPDAPSKIPNYYRGLNQSFSEHVPATNEMYQQPGSARNAGNHTRVRHASRWSFQEGRDESYQTFHTPSKAPCNYGGINPRFSGEDLATKQIYQQPRNVQNSVGRWRPQERRADYCLPPATPTKPSHCYGGLNWGFRDTDLAMDAMFQQPRNAQSSATRWRPEKRKADCCLPPASCLKAPRYYGGLNMSFSEEDPSTSRTHQPSRNPQNSVTSWRLQHRRSGHFPLLHTNSRSPYCHRGLNQSFNQHALAIDEMYQQPRNAQSSVSRFILQDRRPNYPPLPATPSMAPHSCGGLYQSFNEHDPGTNEMYRQPRGAQNAATRWRPQERRASFSLPPITPTKPSHCYGGLNWSFREEDSATRGMYQQPRNAQNSVIRWKLQERRADDSLLPASPLQDPHNHKETAGFEHFGRCPKWGHGPYPYKQPDFRQPRFRTGDNCGYVMRKKYSSYAQYRPY